MQPCPTSQNVVDLMDHSNSISSCMQMVKQTTKSLMRHNSGVERKETMECFSDVTHRMSNLSCRFESYWDNQFKGS